MKEYEGDPGYQADAGSDSERPVMISGELKETVIGPEG